MRKRVIDEICDYVKFLNDTYNIEVTLHPLGWDDYLFHTRIVECNSHKNVLCQQLKIANHESNNMCFEEQYKCFEKRNGPDSYFFTCFAGVTQFICPIYRGVDAVGYIAVGNFYEDKRAGLQLLKTYCDTENINYKNMKDFYEDAITELKFSKEFLDTIIAPICSMIEVAYLQSSDVPLYDDDESFYLRLLSYIKTNYTKKLSVEYLSKRQNCSVSYLSHFFKKQSGMSLPEYINFLRINDAKKYLEMTNMSIQEIAFALGYSCSNYFSTIFKQKVGCSPKKYREKTNAEK